MRRTVKRRFALSHRKCFLLGKSDFLFLLVRSSDHRMHQQKQKNLDLLDGFGPSQGRPHPDQDEVLKTVEHQEEGGHGAEPGSGPWAASKTSRQGRQIEGTVKKLGFNLVSSSFWV